MLIPGSVNAGGDWVEAASLARAIETEMIADDLLDLAEEDEDTTRQRRRTFVAMARAIVSHLRGQMDITIEPGALRATGETAGQLPAGSTSFTVVGNQVTIPAGDIRAAGATGIRIPHVSKTLSGTVS
jgi:hypothetical protein